MQGRIDYVDINTSALCDKYLCEDCPAHINAADDVLHTLIKERQK